MNEKIVAVVNVQAFCAIFFATLSLAQANSQISNVGNAQAAAERVFAIIDRQPKINSDEKVNYS